MLLKGVQIAVNTFLALVLVTRKLQLHLVGYLCPQSKYDCISSFIAVDAHVKGC